MRTAADHQRGHGGHLLWWSAVLAVCVVAAVGVFWTISTWPRAQHALDEASGPAGVPASGRSGPGDESAGRPAVRSGRVRAAAPAGRPQHLDIPALALHAPVVPIDLLRGVLTPPADPAEIGWWREGAPAGTTAGTVVLTGHTVHTGGGAMDNLEQLRPSQLVLLTVRGATVRYRVDRVQVLSKPALADQARSLFGQQGAARLVLVTCENWNGQEYLSNVVVTARPLLP